MTSEVSEVTVRRKHLSCQLRNGHPYRANGADNEPVPNDIRVEPELGPKPGLKGSRGGRIHALTDGGDEGGIEGVLAEAKEQASLADAAVAD